MSYFSSFLQGQLFSTYNNSVANWNIPVPGDSGAVKGIFIRAAMSGAGTFSFATNCSLFCFSNASTNPLVCSGHGYDDDLTLVIALVRIRVPIAARMKGLGQHTHACMMTGIIKSAPDQLRVKQNFATAVQFCYVPKIVLIAQ